MDSNYYYYCLHRFRWTPRQFMNMSMHEKAFVIAAIDIRIKKEKK